MKKLMLICAPVSSRSGYGDHARDLVTSLIKHDKYDVIIGSSMGGWFAWHLGKELSTPVLLLNPALHSRMIEPLMEISNFYRIGSWVEEERERSSVFLALGRLDDVIDPKETLEWISDHDNNSLSCMTIMVDDYGHRTDVKNFQKIFNRFKLDIIETNELQPKLV